MLVCFALYLSWKIPEEIWAKFYVAKYSLIVGDAFLLFFSLSSIFPENFKELQWDGDFVGVLGSR